MNAFDLIEPEPVSDPYWLGRLSAAIAIALPIIEVQPKTAKGELRQTLAAFLRSPLPSEELKSTLRGYMK